MLLKNKNKKKKVKSSFKINWNGVPATVRPSLMQKSLLESLFTSVFCHIGGFLLIWAITFSLIFFGVVPKIFPKQKGKIKDIEFIISDKSKQSASSVTKTEQISNTRAVTTPTQNKVASDNSSTKTSAVPDFSIPIPNLKSLSSGLNTSSKNKIRSSGIENSNSSLKDDNAFSSDGNSASNSGKSQNGVKNIIAAYDISPYVNELKRNIRWNWKSPKSGENKRVELFLRIAKDGRLIILNVKRTSEVSEVDNAALNAVKKCLPLNPLPSKYKKSYLDIIFTFDSNAVGSRY